MRAKTKPPANAAAIGISGRSLAAAALAGPADPNSGAGGGPGGSSALSGSVGGGGGGGGVTAVGGSAQRRLGQRRTRPGGSAIGAG